MFELLAAIGLGGYLYGKCCIDKADSRRNDNDFEKARKDFENFSKTYSSLISSVGMREMITALDPRLNEVKEELKNVTGIIPTQTMIHWGYLAKRGEVPDLGTLSSRLSDNILTNTHDLIWIGIGTWSQYNIKEMSDARLKFLKWYDAELCSHGMPYHLKFAAFHGRKMPTGDYIYEYVLRKDVSECKAVYPACFFWEPTRIHCLPNLEGAV